MDDFDNQKRWVNAQQALRLVREIEPGAGWAIHQRKLVDWAILGLPTRCATGRVTVRTLRDGNLPPEVISGDVPKQFWESSLNAGSGGFNLDLTRGTMSGVVRGQRGKSLLVSLTGISFDAEALHSNTV